MDYPFTPSNQASRWNLHSTRNLVYGKERMEHYSTLRHVSHDGSSLNVETAAPRVAPVQLRSHCGQSFAGHEFFQGSRGVCGHGILSGFGPGPARPSRLCGGLAETTVRQGFAHLLGFAPWVARVSSATARVPTTPPLVHPTLFPTRHVRHGATAGRSQEEQLMTRDLQEFSHECSETALVDTTMLFCLWTASASMSSSCSHATEGSFVSKKLQRRRSHCFWCC